MSDINKNKIRAIAHSLYKKRRDDGLEDAPRDNWEDAERIFNNKLRYGWWWIRQFFKKYSNSIIALGNIILVVITLSSLDYARQANERAERLFVGENRPLIDVTPIGISQNDDGMAETVFSIVNYSGFEAMEIGFDLKYGGYGWIGEWLKARDHKNKQGQSQGVVKGKFYPSPALSLIKRLGPGETRRVDETGEQLRITGALTLESDVCGKDDKEGFPVLVRVTWQNKNRHVFDEVHKYKLICTKDTEGTHPARGRSFTFIPEGITSQKATS